jgi:hypothetical protein
MIADRPDRTGRRGEPRRTQRSTPAARASHGDPRDHRPGMHRAPGRRVRAAVSNVSHGCRVTTNRRARRCEGPGGGRDPRIGQASVPFGHARQQHLPRGQLADRLRSPISTEPCEGPRDHRDRDRGHESRRRPDVRIRLRRSHRAPVARPCRARGPHLPRGSPLEVRWLGASRASTPGGNRGGVARAKVSTLKCRSSACTCGPSRIDKGRCGRSAR